jgi:DNA-binding Lrp family transcriptional regulator
MENRVSKETINRVKEELPFILDENPILSFPAIAKRLNISRTALWAIRKKNKRISNMLDKYMATKNEDVPKLVRQTWEGRLIGGKAQGVEYMFFMMNHFPNEYQDKRALINNNFTNNLINNEQNHILIADKYLRSLPEKDLNDLIAGLNDRKQDQSYKSRI